MGHLTTLCNLKPVLGITQADTTQDAALNILINQCSAAIQEWTGRTFGSRTYTEYYSGNNDPVLVLNQRPVLVTGLRVWADDAAYGGQAPNAFAATTELTVGTDFYLLVDQPDGTSRSGLLYRINNVWNRRFVTSPQNIASSAPYPNLNIKTVYTAGYASIPADLQLACNILVGKVRQMLPHGGPITAESWTEYSYQIAHALGAGLISSEVGSLLARYRNFAVG